MSEPAPNSRDPKRSEVYDLADALLSGAISAEQSRRLGELVGADDESLQHYIRFMFDSATLGQWGSEEEAIGGELPGDAIGGPQAADLACPSAAGRGSSGGLSAPTAAFPLLATLFGGTALSYALAALIVAVGVIAAGLWKPVGDPQRRGANDGVVFSPTPVTTEAEPAVLATVTAAAGCRWANPKAALREGDAVRVGQTLALTSGSLEVAYNTGTKVVLQGRATFLAEAHNGGFLSQGRAIVSVGDKRGLVAAEARHRESRPTPHMLFGVRTPTADITDNDTAESEFSVEVDAVGAAFTRVIRGMVTFHVRHIAPYNLTKDYCAMSGTGAAHDGMCIFVNGKQPMEFAVEGPRQPSLSSTENAAGRRRAEERRRGLRFYPYEGQPRPGGEPAERQF